MQPCVMIATPSIYGDLYAEYGLALVETQSQLSKHGIKSRVALLHGVPYIGKARNILAGMAVRDPEITDVFFIDYDLGWPAHKVVEFLQRPEDIVAGVYPNKRDDSAWPCALEQGEDGKFIKSNDLYRAVFAPGGFMRIKRGVLEKLSKTAVVYKDPYGPTGPHSDLWNFFDARVVDLDMEYLRATGIDHLTHTQALYCLRQALGLAQGAVPNAQFWGEDYWFCMRWKEQGGEIWVDPDITFTHTGSKQYSGRLATAMNVA